MLDEQRLLAESRSLARKNQRLPILLSLAHVEQPATTRSITDRLFSAGIREVRSWNVTDILRSAAAKGLVGQLPTGWRLLQAGIDTLKSEGIDLSEKATISPSDSVLPRELFSGTRSYLERVVKQINASYDFGLYDCCAVMCRRLGETLIIEVYEARDRASTIKGSDGSFMMLNGLLGVLGKDTTMNLGRNAKRGLSSLKDLGDKSAHNRRFNALQADIDIIRSDFRTAVEELLHLAGLRK